MVVKLIIIEYSKIDIYKFLGGIMMILRKRIASDVKELTRPSLVVLLYLEEMNYL